ncbi:hypothetical protein [Natronococcus sp.]|uniref:hypothetical protein n=1 Tax=Natronococcus sp. TaxID=35747 RepID=UPI0025D2CFF2|nr:hypothetical protein [Natronococcus sp.]
MTDGPFDRRHVLAGLGTAAGAAVAGCSDLPWNDAESTATTFARTEIDPILTGSVPDVDRPAPVEPAASALEDARSRIDEVLEPVPDTVDPDDVPNGVVRESIADRRDSALEGRAETVDAPADERYRALRTTRGAREDARASATTLTGIEADRESLLAELDNERARVRSTVTERLEDVDYRGEDGNDGRLRAALLFAAFEDDLETAARRVERWDVDATTDVVDLGGEAGDLEFAVATASVWEHLFERYAEDAGARVDLEPVFADALQKSLERATDVSLPDQGEDDWLAALVDREVEQGFDQTVLWDAVRPVYRARERLQEAVDDDRLGTGLAAALRFEGAFRAFELVRERFEDGELASPESIEEIRAQRTAAVSAAESVRGDVTGPSLGADVLAETVRSLERADDTLRRRADGDPEANVTLGSEYSEYVRLEARFETLPDAVAPFRGRLLED